MHQSKSINSRCCARSYACSKSTRGLQFDPSFWPTRAHAPPYPRGQANHCPSRWALRVWITSPRTWPVMLSRSTLSGWRDGRYEIAVERLQSYIGSPQCCFLRGFARLASVFVKEIDRSAEIYRVSHGERFVKFPPWHNVREEMSVDCDYWRQISCRKVHWRDC